MAMIGIGASSAIALPRPMVEPPPMATAQSAPSSAASARALRALSIGTCISAPSWMPARLEPSSSPTFSAWARCGGVQRTSARVDPIASTSSRIEASFPDPKTTREGSAV